MARTACINTPKLALQLLLLHHPAWSAHPTALLSRDSPYGTILAVNRRAGKAGIAPGMRYTAGLSLNAELRAGTTEPQEIADGVQTIRGLLQKCSPEVETSPDEPGIFWVNACGLTPLYGTLESWAHNIRQSLKKAGFQAITSIGYTRIGSYVAAKTSKTSLIFGSPAEERSAILKAPLHSLDLAVNLQERLEKLGIHTLDSFLRLSSGSIRRRFGPKAERVHHTLSGALSLPLQAEAERKERSLNRNLPFPLTDWYRLLPCIEESLAEYLEGLAVEQELIREIELSLFLENGSTCQEQIRPAGPTLDLNLLMELLSLRLKEKQLADGVNAFALYFTCIGANHSQEELFPQQHRRDENSAAQAFARIRAAFGNQAVQRARLKNEQLPEQSFSWEPFLPDSTVKSSPVPVQEQQQRGGLTLVRGILPEPLPLMRDFDRGFSPMNSRKIRRFRVLERWGPYEQSGSWWAEGYQRSYYFFETETGALLWVYHDRLKRQWLLYGMVG